ncbi:HET-domain-containing protein, partial [Bimuria novae-zelandiae CBS 107.79]
MRQPLSGRVIPRQIRHSELRCHLDNCLDNHEQCFLREFKTGTVEEHFWLIDTIKRMVVPKGQNTEYAALSYVWGGSRADYTHFKKLALRNAGIWSTINRLVAGNGTPGAKLPENLPATISDAIDFCRGIGIRFLWIDSICIDQESQEMKDYLIPKMDSIYLRAIVTIIAAAGDDAHAGLPGVRPGTRSDNRDIISIQGRKFITAYARAKEIIAKTTWWKRAWTFQEGWLSPRCFIFTPHEVFFCC